MHQSLIWLPLTRRLRDAPDDATPQLAPSPREAAFEQSSSADTWLTDVIRECQVIAGAAIDQSPERLLILFSEAVRRLPGQASGPSLTIARDVLTRTAGQIIRNARLEESADVSRAFVRVMCTPGTGLWQSELLALVEIAATTLREQHAPDRRSNNTDERSWYVRETLAFIDSTFHDPGCVLSAAASSLRLTASHLSRILTRETGEGFVAHLRRRRVKEGSRLLEASDLRIKEIAIEVGYTNRRQFERDFKRLSGTTPNSLRESRRALCKK